MNRNQAFASAWLSKEDVPNPVRVTIADVRIEKLREQDTGNYRDKPVMSFREDIKPLVMNNVNWTICENAFGMDSDQWIGKAIEVYVDPNVMFGKRAIGGIRLRLPLTATAAPPAPRQQPPSTNGRQGTPPAPQPPVKNAQPATNQRRPLTIEEKHAGVLKAYAEAATSERIQSLMEWARQQRFNPHQEEEQTGAYYAAMERVALAQAPVNGSPIDEEQIPF